MSRKSASANALALMGILTVTAVTARADGGLPAKGLGCVPDPNTLCLGGGRFSVTVDWEDDFMASGQGLVYPVGGDNFGLFYYNDPRYLELLIKVLDGCAINDFYWVFAAGLSDFEQTITVTDTFTGLSVDYFNTLGDYVVLNDLGAFDCTVESDGGGAAAPKGTTGPAPSTMKLADDRFLVDVDWLIPSPPSTGVGSPMEVTSHSGYFWFFDVANPDLLVHMYDGTSTNGHFWVFGGAPTAVEYTIQVVDRCTGASQSYHKPAGDPPPPFADDMAFPVAGGNCIVFEDGFESGDATAWTSMTGG